EIQRQQILQVVAAGIAGRRQHSAECPVEERSLDIVECVIRVLLDGAESRCLCRKRCQQRMAHERVDHPERHVGAAVGLHVDGNPPGLATIFEHANLEMWRRSVVFALVPIRTTAEHTVLNRHHFLLTLAWASDEAGRVYSRLRFTDQLYLYK